MIEFPTSALLAEALADAVAAALRARLAREGKAALAVSGGTTPVRFFAALSCRKLDWPDVTVTLVDDRWVPDTSPRSNAALVRQYLLQNEAAGAKFLPLVNAAPSPEEGLAAANASLATVNLPFAAIVLGMGTDGHTASFFPGGDRLAAALAPDSGQFVVSMRAQAAIEPRITLTLPVLLAADYLALHIEGAPKRGILQNLDPALPVAAVLAGRPATAIYWSP